MSCSQWHTEHETHFYNRTSATFWPVHHSTRPNEPGARGPKMRQAVVSGNSQLYSGHRTIYTLRVKQNHMNIVYNYKNKTYLAKKKNMFFPRSTRLATAQLTICCTWRATKNTFQEQSRVLKKRVTRLLFSQCFLTSTQNSRVAVFVDCVMTLLHF